MRPTLDLVESVLRIPGKIYNAVLVVGAPLGASTPQRRIHPAKSLEPMVAPAGWTRGRQSGCNTKVDLGHHLPSPSIAQPQGGSCGRPSTGVWEVASLAVELCW